MAANLTTLPQWFDGPLAHLLDRDDVVWALSFVMVAFGLCTTALLAMSAVCVQDTHDDKEYWLAAFGLIQFWIMNVFILHSMRKVWRPLSHGGGAITVLAPPGMQITLRQMKNLDRRWRYCWILGFVGAAPFFVLFGVAFDQILTMLEDSDLEDAFRSVNLTGLGFPGSHIVDWVPSCGGAGTTISAARVFSRLNQVLEFAMTFVYVLCSLVYCAALRTRVELPRARSTNYADSLEMRLTWMIQRGKRRSGASVATGTEDHAGAESLDWSDWALRRGPFHYRSLLCAVHVEAPWRRGWRR